jgi:hypothetical protein
MASDTVSENEVLTAKQERFSRLVAVGKTAAEAYRTAYDTEGNAATVYPEASRLLATPKVTARVSELRERLAVLADINMASVAAELDDARKVARGAETPQASAMIAATKLKANLVGLLQTTVHVNKRISVEMERFRRMPPEDLSAFIDSTYRELAELDALAEGSEGAKELGPGEAG